MKPNTLLLIRLVPTVVPVCAIYPLIMINSMKKNSKSRGLLSLFFFVVLSTPMKASVGTVLPLIESSNVRIPCRTSASSDILKPLWFMAFAAPNHCHISNRFVRQTIHTKFQMSNKISSETSESWSVVCMRMPVRSCVYVEKFNTPNYNTKNQKQKSKRNIFCIIATINTSHNFFHPDTYTRTQRNGNFETMASVYWLLYTNNKTDLK